MYERICRSSGERIIIIAADDPLLVNALQRRAAVVLQKSLREGFGLTVSEAMWKGRAVIGGAVGGILHQIVNGQSGFLVSNVGEAADHITMLLKDAMMRRNLGRRARERVRRHFLMTRLLEDWPDLIAGLTLANPSIRTGTCDLGLALANAQYHPDGPSHAHRPNRASRRERAAQALWRHGTRRALADRRAYCPGT
jgi:hypothetical protein